MKRLGVLLACVLFTVCTLGICACTDNASSSQGSTQKSISTSSSASSGSSPSGIQTIGSGSSSVEVTNTTGYDIVGVKVKGSSDDAFAPENIFEGFVFKNGDTVNLLFTQVPDAQSYDVVLITNEESKIGVKDIQLVDAKDLVFCFEDGLGFVTFVDPVTGENANSRDVAASAEKNAKNLPSDLQSEQG